jgi:hypothetical protein
MTLRLIQLVVATTLLVAAGGKLVAPGDLAGALRASRTIPRSLATAVAAAVVVLEIALAVGILSLQGTTLAGFFAGAAVLGAGFVLWSGSVRLRGIKIRCGCFGGASKNVSRWTVGRAFGFGALSVAGLLTSFEGIPLFEPSALAAASASGYSISILLLTAFARTRSALLLTGDSLQSLQSLSGEVRT